MLRQRTVIVYGCSASTDICSDEPLNNKWRGKIWDLIIDNTLAEKGTNFSLLSPICLLLPYHQAAKIIAAFSEPHFNIQRSFISHYFSCNSYKQGTTYIFPSLLRSVKFAAVLFDIFQTYCCVRLYKKHSIECALLLYSSYFWGLFGSSHSSVIAYLLQHTVNCLVVLEDPSISAKKGFIFISQILIIVQIEKRLRKYGWKYERIWTYFRERETWAHAWLPSQSPNLALRVIDPLMGTLLQYPAKNRVRHGIAPGSWGFIQHIILSHFCKTNI